MFFYSSLPEAGIQIPKGTVKLLEAPFDTVCREIKEETGLKDFQVDCLLANDLWENSDGSLQHRFFYKLTVYNAPDKWDHQPTGGGEEEGLTFRYFWISSKEEVELSKGHGDYLDKVL